MTLGRPFGWGFPVGSRGGNVTRSWRRWAFAIVLTLLLATPFSRAQQTVYVDDDNCPGPGSGTDPDPYCTIQSAICAIKDTGGGTVLVRPGFYNESLRMFPDISVVSTDGPAVTTIDATGRPCTTHECVDSLINLVCAVVVWGSGSGQNDRLEGFHITGGSGLFRDFEGGTPPNAISGGGVFVFNSSSTITNNEIVGNTLTNSITDNFWGGGVYLIGYSFDHPFSTQANDCPRSELPGLERLEFNLKAVSLQPGIDFLGVVREHRAKFILAQEPQIHEHIGVGGQELGLLWG